MTQKIETDQKPKPVQNLGDLADYIILPGRSHEGYSYPDLYVAKTYAVDNLDWCGWHHRLQESGFQMLTIRQFVDFTNLLNSGNAFDGRKKRVPPSELKQLFGKLISSEGDSNYTMEYFDALFTLKSDKKSGQRLVYINTNHKSQEGKFLPQDSDSIQCSDCLRIDNHGICTAHQAEDFIKFKISREHGVDYDHNGIISFDDWMQRATAEGLPPVDIKSPNLAPGMDRKISYLSPGDGSVAVFVTGRKTEDVNSARFDCWNYNPTFTWNESYEILHDLETFKRRVRPCTPIELS